MVKNCDRGLENTSQEMVVKIEVMQIQKRCLNETFSFP